MMGFDKQRLIWCVDFDYCVVNELQFCKSLPTSVQHC